jgi:hypothetical protein
MNPDLEAHIETAFDEAISARLERDGRRGAKIRASMFISLEILQMYTGEFLPDIDLFIEQCKSKEWKAEFSESEIGFHVSTYRETLTQGE